MDKIVIKAKKGQVEVTTQDGGINAPAALKPKKAKVPFMFFVQMKSKETME